ncbi:hypothetical protein L484_027164 [Morus notabilis]|uniref:Uncharacterized protein n=1 Tax=Morus notabilis TaxID=981085 RepID=W9S162_9ROSA|nr:hypothetical protein L484_027164 [Morus notabilis]
MFGQPGVDQASGSKDLPEARSRWRSGSGGEPEFFRQASSDSRHKFNFFGRLWTIRLKFQWDVIYIMSIYVDECCFCATYSRIFPIVWVGAIVFSSRYS